MDDVDAVHGQMARNILESGDWVTMRLDGIPYLEKAPLLYWIIALLYRISGVHDWVARIPIAFSAILLCWLVARFGSWAFGNRAGLYGGLCLSTCVGLFLFTRILIPDVMLTLTLTLAFWSFLRALEEDEPHPRYWAFLLAAALGAGVMLKGLIALVLPAGAALLYLLCSRQLTARRTWRRLHPASGLGILLALALPWHVLATLRNPPFLDFTLRSGPGQYHGFFWFYLVNEHFLRFLNLRYPHDYNTVPRLWFWSLHLIWLFPWSVYLPAAARLNYLPIDRSGRTRLLALCWTGFLLVFFSFSTTQEYYSMPCYPALALLIGSAMAAGGRWVDAGTRLIAAIAAVAATIVALLLIQVRGVPAPGDISAALTQHAEAYTLSLGHIEDLTVRSFAYLKLPLVLAGAAFLLGALGAWKFASHRAFAAMALMMALFTHAARLALVVFDPYLSSRPLAQALSQAPPGRLIVDGEYYAFSSVFFYTNRRALLLNGRVNNLEYGSNAPGAPRVFIGDDEFRRLWQAPETQYVLADHSEVHHLTSLAGAEALHRLAESGGKLLFVNRPLTLENNRASLSEGGRGWE